MPARSPRIWRWPGSRRSQTRSRKRSGNWSAAVSPPDGMLDELGTRWEITRNYFRLYACCNPIHPALDCLAAALAELRPRAGAGRADRGRDLPLRVGDAQPGPAELFRVEILAAACRGGDGRARRRRLRRTRRQRLDRSGHRGIAPAGAYQRGPGDERAGAAIAAGAGHGHAERRHGRRRIPATAIAAISTSRFPKRRSAPSSANSPAPC